MPPLYGFWLFLKNNPVAQGVAVVVLFFTLKFGHAKYNQRKGRLKERADNKERSLEQLDDIEETLDERLEKTNTARDNIPRVLHADELPERTRERYFSDRRSGAEDE